jgi:metallopeptidase MepB
MWSSIFEADPLSASAGLRYRDIILGSGGSRDAADFLREFLGREPSTAAFLRAKGLTPKE